MLLCKIADFEAFLGPVKVHPKKSHKDIQKQLCQSWFPIQNQSFGNRTTNIDPAQGSQNLQ